MSVCVVEDRSAIAQLFEGWDDTFIGACLRDYVGAAYADNLLHPESALICLGDFCFLAGAPSPALVAHKPETLRGSGALLAPQTRLWDELIEAHFKENAVRHTRFSIKKEGDVFNREKLQSYVSRLPAGYALRLIDRQLYHQALSENWSADLCFNYKSFEEYQTSGLGVVALKGQELVSGASSYISYSGGIEIEIDTREDQRRNGLALACGARLISECLQRGLYPSWDAHDRRSLALAEKLGYSFDKEYTVYMVEYI